MPRPAPAVLHAGVFGSMYLVQGTIYGFAGLVLIPSLAAQGVSVAGQTWLVGVAGLPWIFKLLWAPLVDHPRLRQRPTRLVTAAMAVLAGLLALWSWAAGSTDLPMGWLAGLWLAVNVALSLQDVATDALALDRIDRDERGTINAVMLAGHHLGDGAVAGLGLAALTHRHGMATGLLAAAGIVAVVALAPGRLGTAAPIRPPTPRGLAALLRAFVRDRPLGGVIALTMLVFAADVLTSALSGALLISHLHWTPAQLTDRIPLVLLGGSLVGYLLAAQLVDRFGHGRTTLAATVLLGLCWLAFAATPQWWPSVRFVQAFVAVQSVVTAVLYTGVHAMLMDTVRIEVRASQFALLTALLNSPRAWAPLLGAPLLEQLGFAGVFAVCGAWQVGVGWLVHRVAAKIPAGVSHAR